MRIAICDSKKLLRAGFAIVVLVACLSGCERESAKPAAQPRARFESVRGRAVIRGVVRLQGTPPVMQEIANDQCHRGAPKLMEESVVVGNDGGLANVFVSVEGLPEVDGSTLQPALLDQVHCQYVPHAIGVCVGQELRIRSSDDTVHNVHYSPEKNPAKNFGMQSAGDEKKVTFDGIEFIRVRCDVHPWMNVTIGVFATPFFAITDANGKFEIRGLPVGKFKLVVTHERYGELKRDVVLSDAGSLNEDFVYKAP